MITLYLDGSSWLHRQRASTKLVALAGLSLAMIWLDSLETLITLWVVMVILYASLGGRGFQRLRALSLTLVPLMVLVTLGQWLAQSISPKDLAATLIQLWALIGLANLVTITTRIQDMVDTLMPLLRPIERSPLGRLGFRADYLGLAIGLVIRMVTLCSQHWRDSREILLLRGARRPFGLGLLMTLRRSLWSQQRISEALQLRMSSPLAIPPAAEMTASPQEPGLRNNR